MSPRPSAPVVALSALFLTAPAAAQNAADYYDANCAACHTIGQGAANGGPDLKDVTGRRERDWLIKFLINPEAFSSDPAVVQMIKDAGGLEMPPSDGMTPAMAAALLELIEQRSDSAGAGIVAAPEQPLTADDVARGRDLFTGRTRLSANGPACVQCHDAATLASPGGGRMGPDLTAVHERLGGSRGLTGWLRAAPTPVMRAIYQSAPIAPEESRAITAFLEDTARREATERSARMLPFLGGSVALATVVLVGIGWTGARRFRGVRAGLVAAHRHAIGTGGSR